MHVRVLPFLAVLALLLPVGSQSPVSAQSAPYEINTILALTGPAAFIGGSEQKALAILEELVNKSGGIKGRPIHFAVVDDQSNPAVSVQLVNGLIAKKTQLILGPSFTATCLADGPLVAKSGPVDYCFSPSISPAPGSYQYSSTVSTRNDARALAHYYRDRGWTRIALMTTTDASGQQFEQYFDEALTLPENAGLKLVAREHWAGTDLNVTAQAERIKASGAQAMIGWSAGTATATLLRGLHDTGVDLPIACGNGNMVYEQLAGYAAFLPSNLYFPGRRSLVLDPTAPKAVHAAQVAYYDALKAGGLRSTLLTTLAWDPALLVIDGLKKLGTDATAEQLN
ncbi:MAG TPA: ABC transporter substrate-binding protein, partial [Candidatus Lustribacter sp.]|nr:ABC transporter substrate-binding protein [Candidatus Lustribacter sp.]